MSNFIINMKRALTMSDKELKQMLEDKRLSEELPEDKALEQFVKKPEGSLPDSMILSLNYFSLLLFLFFFIIIISILGSAKGCFINPYIVVLFILPPMIGILVLIRIIKNN